LLAGKRINLFSINWINEILIFSKKICISIFPSVSHRFSGRLLIRRRYIYGGYMASYEIVLAEGHIPLRRIIKKIVQGNGELTVVGKTNDGLELLELLEQFLPDMVITDISMPRLRGLEVSKKIN
jgi:PleD family two-component response regulator